MGANAINGQQRQHECDAFSQIGYVENILDCFNHSRMTSQVPPALVIFCRALSVK